MVGMSLTQPTDEDPSESMAQYGGPVPEGETDDVEANTTIKDNPTTVPTPALRRQS